MSYADHDHRRLTVQTGQRFGRGVVVEPEIRLPVRNRRGARLRCDCGTVYEAALMHLLGGRTNSCGCLQRERAAQSVRQLHKHGMRDHPLYDTWCSMMRRCHSERSTNFGDYGGRGITVCPEWHDVSVFIAWIEVNLGPRPEGMTLDRINNETGNYEPGNVRWATQKEQCSNRRPRRWQRKPSEVTQ